MPKSLRAGLCVSQWLDACFIHPSDSVVPSRHDSGASVPLPSTLVFLKNPLSHLTVLLSGAAV